MRRAWVVTTVLLFGVLAVAAAGLIVMKLRRPSAAAQAEKAAFEPTEAVEVVAAHEISWQTTADLVGTVFAMRSVTVRNELPATVVEVGFQSGDTVEPGQVLIRQDDSTEKADLEAARAAVRVAEANITQVDTQIRLAQVELDRLARAESKAVAEIDLDRARAKVDAANADRGRWVAEVDQANAKVDQVQTRLAKLTIKAPFRARAGMRTVHEGQYLKEGTDVIELQELTKDIYLDFAIPQENAARAKPGMVVMAKADIFGSDPIKVTVASVDATVNLETRNLRVRATVDNSRGLLVPGMFVQVRVPIEEPRTFVVVPTTAVRRAAYANLLFVVAPDPKGDGFRAQQRFVNLGETVGTDVIVTKGLAAGEQVAAAGSFKLRDGEKVMVGPPPGSAPPAASAGPADASTDGTSNEPAKGK